jgi:hypothetical protein
MFYETEKDAAAAEARERARQEARDNKDRLYSGEWVGGRLLQARKAPYHDDPANDLSYTIKLQTSYGVQSLWGKDLERAVARSKSHVKVGDLVAARITRTDKFVVPPKEPGGKPDTREFHRFEVEQAIFVVKRQREARQILDNPISARRAGKDGRVVTGSYLLMAGAEMLAEIQFTTEEKRKAFIGRIREAAGLSPQRREEPEVRSPTQQRAEPPSGNVTHLPKRQGFARE